MTVVGSGTVVPDGERVCSGYFVEMDAHRVLLDCGPGTAHHLARFDLPWSRVTHVVISHFHTDHIGGLPILLFALKHGLPAPREAALTVIGPSGTRALFGRLADAFGDHLVDPGFPVHIREVGSGEGIDLGDEAVLRAQSTPHTEESQGYRVESGGAVLGYTGDTGADDALGRFFRGAHVLIAECSAPDDAPVPGHLTPATVAALARGARPERLVATHIYPQLPHDRVADRIRAAGWTGDVTVARDGLRIDVVKGNA